MIDVNKEIERDLSDLGYKTVYQYPSNFNSLPVVCYYQLTDNPIYNLGDTDIESGTNATVQIDIYTAKRSELGTIATAVTNQLHSKDWYREMSMDVPTTGKPWHKTMRFAKIF